MMAIRISTTALLDRVRQATVSALSRPKAAARTQLTGAKAVPTVSRKAQVQAARVEPLRPGPPIASAAVVTITGSTATPTAVPSRPLAIAPVDHGQQPVGTGCPRSAGSPPR